MAADKRIRITPKLEEKILKLADAEKMSDALPTLEAAVNLMQMLKDAQEKGSKFYEVDDKGEKYIVKFVLTGTNDVY